MVLPDSSRVTLELLLSIISPVLYDLKFCRLFLFEEWGKSCCMFFIFIFSRPKILPVWERLKEKWRLFNILRSVTLSYNRVLSHLLELKRWSSPGAAGWWLLQRSAFCLFPSLSLGSFSTVLSPIVAVVPLYVIPIFFTSFSNSHTSLAVLYELSVP